MKRESGTRRGFTIVEGLIASAVLAMAVTAIIAPFATAARCQHESARTAVATFLAQEMMEEILTRPFYDPDGDSDLGPESGEDDRTEFDNVDDYDGLVESGSDSDGLQNFLQEAAGDRRVYRLSREVDVEYVHLDGQTVFFEKSSIARVIVTVSCDGAAMVTLTRLVRAPDKD